MTYFDYYDDDDDNVGIRGEGSRQKPNAVQLFLEACAALLLLEGKSFCALPCRVEIVENGGKGSGVTRRAARELSAKISVLNESARLIRRSGKLNKVRFLARKQQPSPEHDTTERKLKGRLFSGTKRHAATLMSSSVWDEEPLNSPRNGNSLSNDYNGKWRGVKIRMMGKG